MKKLSNVSINMEPVEGVALAVGGVTRIAPDSVVNATGDVLTVSTLGNITRRTAPEVRGDIGAQATIGDTNNRLVRRTNAGLIATGKISETEAGVVGIGVTPGNWSSALRVMQIGDTGAIWANEASHDFRISSGLRADTAIRAMTSLASTSIQLNEGLCKISTWSAVSAGNTPVETVRLHIDSVGTGILTAPEEGAALTVGGATRVNGHIGIGVTPSTDWHSTARVIELGTSGALVVDAIASVEQTGLYSGVRIESDGIGPGSQNRQVGASLDVSAIVQIGGTISFQLGTAVAQGSTVGLNSALSITKTNGVSVLTRMKFHSDVFYAVGAVETKITSTDSNNPTTIPADRIEGASVLRIYSDEPAYAVLGEGTAGQRVTILNKNTNDPIYITNGGNTYLYGGRGKDFFYDDSKWFPID